MSDYKIQQARSWDRDYILKAWRDAYRPSHSSGILSISPLYGSCQQCAAPVPYDYAAVMQVTMANILEREGIVIHVARNPRATPPNDIHGFIIVELGANVARCEPPDYAPQVEQSKDPLIHFVYVKKLYRRLGIARALFQGAGIDPRGRFLYSCTTASSISVERKGKIPLAVWAPLSARFSKEHHDPEHHRPAIRSS